ISVPRSPSVAGVAVGVAGAVALVVFVLVERRVRSPMVPLNLFSSKQFSAVNLVTVWVYAANGLLFFFVVQQLQVVGRYSPILAGTALLPVTLAMLALSSRAGGLSQRIGPRLPMTVGTALCVVGVLLLSHVGGGHPYYERALPGAVLFGVGLSLT